MSRSGKKDINVEHNKFLKNIEKYIKEHNIYGVFVGHQGGSDLVAGEKKILTLIKDNSSISTQDILDRAKELAEGTDDGELEFETWRGQNMFPPLPCDPKSKSWDYEARRSYLRLMFNRLGYYKGSFKSIKEPSHCPPGFPADKLSWRTFGEKGGPNGVIKRDADKIIEAFLSHYMPGTEMSEYFRGNDRVQEDVSDQSTRPLPTASQPSAATPAASGPSSRPATLTSTPRIPSFSGTPTIIFKKGQVSHSEPEDGEIDSSLEETEHDITYHDDDDDKSETENEETEEQSEENEGTSGEKKKKLSPIRLPTSSSVLSEAEKRRERNIQERDRLYQEYEQRRLLEQGSETRDSILGLEFDE